MKIIAIDSSGLVAGVAVLSEDTILADYLVNYQKTHSQTLLPMLEEVKNMIGLDLKNVDAIAISSGPGSFTGLRIGSATAKGLGLALDKPLIEVPTLEGLAYNVYGDAHYVCPLMDARRNQVYTAIYRFVPENEKYVMETVVEPCAVEIGDILKQCNELGEGVTFLGDGVPVYEKIIRDTVKVDYFFAPPHMNRQRAGSVAIRGRDLYYQGKITDAAAHQPEYLRKSQAEREREANESHS